MDPSGGVTYGEKTDPFAAHLSTLSQMGLLSSGTNGTPSAPQVTHAPMNEGAEGAARDAAFARAKDRAGLVAQSAMTSLHNIMASRGLQGSSIERTGTVNALQEGVGQLGGVAREQAINEAYRAGDIADEEYQGNIAQRGQDIQARQALSA